MNAIKATCTNGQIVPSEPVNWPEGSRLLVEPLPAEDKIGMSEDEWRDDPESIAEWMKWVDTIEPFVWAPGEEEEYERDRAEHRRFNIEAVRKQMEAVAEVDMQIGAIARTLPNCTVVSKDADLSAISGLVVENS